MVESLKITNRTISSADSNVSGTYTIPASSSVSNFIYNRYNYNTEVVYFSPSDDGAFYTWQVATAGTGSLITSGEASGSICPKGWRLPTGTENGEFYALIVAYNNGALSSICAQPVPGFHNNSGYIVASDTGYRSDPEGNWWSSTASGDSSAYHLEIDSYAHAYDTYGRYNGFNVRCITI